MKSHLLLGMVIGLVAGAFANLYAQSVPLPDCRVWGRQLEEEFIVDLRGGKHAEAASDLATGFQSVRADGIRDRAREIPLLQGSKGHSGAIHGFKVTYSGQVAIVTYQVRQRLPAPSCTTVRNVGVMSVWKPTSHGWQCIARSETPLS